VFISLAANVAFVALVSTHRPPLPAPAANDYPSIDLELVDRRPVAIREPVVQGSQATASARRPVSGLAGTQPTERLPSAAPSAPSSPQTSSGLSPGWIAGSDAPRPSPLSRRLECQRLQNGGGVPPPHCADLRRPRREDLTITGSGDRRRDDALESQAAMNERWRRYREEGGDYPGLRTLPSQF